MITQEYRGINRTTRESNIIGTDGNGRHYEFDNISMSDDGEFIAFTHNHDNQGSFSNSQKPFHYERFGVKER